MIRAALMTAAVIGVVLLLLRHERRNVRAQTRAWNIWQALDESRPVTGWSRAWVWGGDRAARSGTGAAPAQQHTTTTDTAQGQAPARTRRAA